jgi:hypothetical protein
MEKVKKGRGHDIFTAGFFSPYFQWHAEFMDTLSASYQQVMNNNRVL